MDDRRGMMTPSKMAANVLHPPKIEVSACLQTVSLAQDQGRTTDLAKLSLICTLFLFFSLCMWVMWHMWYMDWHHHGKINIEVALASAWLYISLTAQDLGQNNTPSKVLHIACFFLGVWCQMFPFRWYCADCIWWQSLHIKFFQLDNAWAFGRIPIAAPTAIMSHVLLYG